jgi:hypothetical protein
MTPWAYCRVLSMETSGGLILHYLEPNMGGHDPRVGAYLLDYGLWMF